VTAICHAARVLPKAGNPKKAAASGLKALRQAVRAALSAVADARLAAEEVTCATQDSARDTGDDRGLQTAREEARTRLATAVRKRALAVKAVAFKV